MGLEIEKNREHELLVIKISGYEAIELVLSKIIIPFSEVLKASNAPDIYVGYEKIPFEKRDPMYKSIMRQEFADAMRSV
jgi:hypothetical protein